MPASNELLDIMMGKGPSPAPAPAGPVAPPAAIPPKRGGVGKAITDVLDGIGGALLELRRISPKYQEELRLRKALMGFSDDPIAAAERAVQAGGVKTGLDFYDTVSDNDRMQGVADAQVAADMAREAEVRERTENLVHQRAASLMRAATKDTYPVLRKRALDYYASRGVQPLMDLPETFDDALADMLSRASMSPKDSITIDNTEAYRRSVDADRDEQRKLSDEDRDLGRASTESRAAAAQTAADRRAKASIDAANKRAREANELRERLAKRGRGSRGRWKRDKNGRLIPPT